MFYPPLFEMFESMKGSLAGRQETKKRRSARTKLGNELGGFACLEAGEASGRAGCEAGKGV